jgi:hypothetical protein
MLPYSIAMQIRWEFCNSSQQNSSDKKLEADFTLLLEKNIFYSVLQGSTPTFDIEPKKARQENSSCRAILSGNDTFTLDSLFCVFCLNRCLGGC